MHLVNLKTKGTNLDSELSHLSGKIRIERVSGISGSKSVEEVKSGVCEQGRTPKIGTAQQVNALAAKPE